MPNIRIILVSLLVLAILMYLSILISGGGLRMDHFADLGEKQNTFTLYYMNGCPHCETILPEYKTFVAAGQYTSNGKTTAIRMLEQGDPAAAPELEAHNVTGFPTLYLSTVDGKDIEYKGDRTVSAMKDFIGKNAK
jgi:hypothetical protein